MFAGISLDQAPPIHRPIMFFALGIMGGVLTSFYLMNFAIEDLYRWNSSTIILTHLFTIGCILPIIIGALLQLLPVLFGIKFNHPLLTYFTFAAIPLGLISFVLGFHFEWSNLNIFIHIGLCFLWIMLFAFFGTVLFKSFQNILIDFKSNTKKITNIGLTLFSLNIVLGLIASIWLIMAHMGFPVSVFRPYVTDGHATLMIFSALFTLIFTITSQVIPMFYVTPNFHRHSSKLLILNSLLIYIHLLFFENNTIYIIVKISFVLILLQYFVQLAYLISKRKRKLWDPVISHWKIFIANSVLGIIIWSFKNHFEFVQFSKDQIDSFLGIFLFTGILFPLLIAMLLKIVPFLMWLHLNSLQMEVGRFDIKLPHMKAYISDSHTKYLLFGFYLLELSFLSLSPKIWGLVTLLIAFGFLTILFLAIKAFSRGKNALNLRNQ